MNRTLNPTAFSLSATRRGWLMLALLALLPVAQAQAQSSGRSVTDGTTPLGLTPGAPAGSYTLSGFENVNPYNGNLNFVLPLVSVVGRGGVRHTLPLKIEQHWRTLKTQQTQFTQPYYYPTPNSWEGLAPGYGPGIMTGRVTGVADIFSCPDTLPAVTRMTFTSNDGTEYEFRDALYDGLAKENIYEDDVNTCHIFLTNTRGRVFATFDGSAITFISDTDIGDFYGRDIKHVPNPTGYMLMRDGTRYRLEDGLVKWIQDRNGNRLTFHYNNFNDVDLITDSLNRTVTINYSYGYSDPDLHAQYDEIIYNGFGGVGRSLKVWYKKLQDCLRTTQPGDPAAPWTYGQLFPEIQWVDQDNKYKPWKVSSVQLPDGRQYQMYYNVYGELARVGLPTGGAFEYDYLGSLPGGPDSGAFSGNYIYRRVIERRVYTNGMTLEGRTTFERPADDGVTAEIVVEVAQYNNGSTLLARAKHYYHGSPRESFLWCLTAETNYSKWQDGKEWKTESYDTDGSLKQRVTNTFEQRYGSSSSLAPPNDPRLVSTTTRLVDTNQVTQQLFSYDQYNNKTDVDEYDFGVNGPGILRRRTHTNYLTTNLGVNYTTVNPNTTNPDINATIHQRGLPAGQLVYDGLDLANAKARTTYEYDNYTAGLTDRSNITGHARTQPAPAYTTSYLTRGNVTQTTKWLLPSTAISARMQYDIAGNVVSATDAMGRTTAIDYSDRFGTPDGEARANTPPGQLGGAMTYAFATKATNPAPFNHTAYTQMDYYLGKPVNSEDPNGVVNSGRYSGYSDGSYSDVLDRPTELVVAVGTGVQRRTRFFYNDAGKQITTTSDQTSFADGVLRGDGFYDGLGRTVKTQQSVPDTGGVIISEQKYDGLGRQSQASNPYRPAEAVMWTVTSYDGLSRVKQVTTADNAVVTTAYSGARVLVTDQAGKQRISQSDGLGRLTDVWEVTAADSATEPVTFPGSSVAAGYRTTYSYDVLDDLTRVTQGAQASRSFVYDSLKRLKQAFNPESGTINYTYDANSNLQTKQDARLITTTYFYDALNRLTSRTYTNDPQNTPAVSYKYDNQALPGGAPTFTRGSSIGRLVAVTYGVGSAGSYQGYDLLGRVNVSYQQTDSINYGFGYAYNLGSEMTSETYPSGRQVITEYDSAGRAAGIRAAAVYYAGAAASDATNRIQYTSHGAVSVLKLGNGKWEHTNFNSRLQPTQIGLGTSGTDSSILKLDYGYGTTANNGNVMSQTITAPGLTVNQCYGYDYLNRLASAEEKSGGTACSGTQQWKQAFTYDRFGNRNFDLVNTTANVLGPNPTVSQSTNRIASGQNYGYDSAGNLTSDPTTPVNGVVYDAENRQTQYTRSGQATNSYYYDGDGHRVKKIDNTGTTVFVYNAGGQLIAEYRAGNPSSGGTSYLTSDHLGSTRVVMKSDGTTTTTTRHDYLPFGEEIQAGIGGRTAGQGYIADSVRQKFTQKERDSESGLDYFLARYYSSAEGRFTSVDLAGPDITNPQTLNKYRYGLNNPLRYVDPNGAQEKESWIEGLRRYLSSLFESKAKVRTEEDARPQQPSNPYGLTEEEIVQYHLQGLGQGSRTLFNVVSTLDPTGGSSVLQSFMDRDKGGVALGMAGMAGGPALSKIFGVGNRALTSGELLVGRLGAAEVAAQFSKSGGTLVADVVGVFGAKSQGLASSTKALFNSIMGFAKQEGLSEVRVQAVAVVNKDLEERLIKQGWQKTTVIVDGEKVSAYTRTFQVR